MPTLIAATQWYFQDTNLTVKYPIVVQNTFCNLVREDQERPHAGTELHNVSPQFISRTLFSCMDRIWAVRCIGERTPSLPSVLLFFGISRRMSYPCFFIWCHFEQKESWSPATCNLLVMIQLWISFRRCGFDNFKHFLPIRFAEGLKILTNEFSQPFFCSLALMHPL